LINQNTINWGEGLVHSLTKMPRSINVVFTIIDFIIQKGLATQFGVYNKTVMSLSRFASVLTMNSPSASGLFNLFHTLHYGGKPSPSSSTDYFTPKPEYSKILLPKPLNL